MKLTIMIKKSLFFVLGMIWLNTSGQEKSSSGDHSLLPLRKEMDSVKVAVNEKTDALTFTGSLLGSGDVQVIESGTIGAASQLMIRGLTSINLNVSPYVYVDGIPVRYIRAMPSFLSVYQPTRFNFVDLDDIREIYVAKDGKDLSGIGGRGSNGAIYIETDRGELGGTKIDFSAKYGVLTADYDVDRMGAQQFKDYLRSYLLENGSTTADVAANPIFDPGMPVYNNQTDWMNLISRNARYSDYHIKLKGGDGDARYMFSVGYTSKDETIEGSGLDRLNLRFNLDYKVSPKIEISNSLAYSNMSSDYSEQGANYAIHPIFAAATKAPFLSPYLYTLAGERTAQLADVDDLGKTNPVSLVRSMKNSNDENRVDGKINANWLVAPQTSLQSAFVFNYMNMNEKQYRPALGIVNDLNRIRQNSARGSSELLILWNTWLEKNGTFGSSARYAGKAGFSIESYEEKSLFVRKINAGSDDYETLQQGIVDSSFNLKYQSKLASVYARGDVDLFNRLLVSANLNVEGSSNFGSKGRWGIYPGVRGLLDLLNRSKGWQVAFRAGWGRTGNNDLRAYYQYNLYDPANYFGYGGVYLANVANASIKPEITNTYDAGLSASLFKKRLSLDAGYYYKETSDLITRRAVPIELGLDPQFENNGTMASQGFELSINAQLVQTKNVSWSVNGSLSSLKNEVKQLNNGDIIRSIGNVTTIARVGEPLGAFYGYKILGVFQDEADVNLKKADGTNYKAGDYIIDDVNKDAKINEEDRQVIGSPLPTLFGSAGTLFRYKRISLNALFTFSQGFDVYNSFNQQMHVMKDYSNQSPDVAGRWISASDPGTGLSRAAFDDPSFNGAASDRWLEDGSFVRLKTVTVAYDMPLPSSFRIFRRAGIYVTGENLLTFTNYSGLDPEVVSSADPLLRGIDFGASPLARSYVLGIKLSF